jgi:hypothetical protein
MPKTPIQFENTIIYKIVCNNLEITDCYVGSTTNFNKRKATHKIQCIKDNSKVYKFIRDNGNWENWSMVEIEKYPCKDNNEKFARERYWIETLKSSLNTIIPTRNRKQHYEANKDKLLEYKNNRNIEKHICICGSSYTLCHKSRHERTQKHINFIESLIK